MNKVCQFFLWHWVLIFAVMLLILGSLLITFAQAPEANCLPALEDDVGMEVIGALFVVAAMILLITAPCTYSNMHRVCHWVDHCYPGRCLEVMEEARGEACQDGADCYVYNECPWKIVCCCALFSDWTTHIYSHARHSGCTNQHCWIRRITAYLCCCCRRIQERRAAGEPCCPGQVVCCQVYYNNGNSVQPAETQQDGHHVNPVETNQSDNIVQPIQTHQDQEQCVVCMDQPKQMAFQPCGHNATCSGCAQQLLDRHDLCPICRSTIASLIRIYT